MSTATSKLGPADRGLPLTYEEFMSADYREGFKYELIDGRLYVSPVPNLPENSVEEWIRGELFLYSREHEEVVNYVSAKARVFVPGRKETTCPEPDASVFHDFPHHVPIKDRDWRKISPILVVEVLTGDDPDKDLVRNVDLYLRVPSIKEYWIFDAREDADRPTLIVHRRRAGKWQISEWQYGDEYSTRMLPGFKLVVDPHR